MIKAQALFFSAGPIIPLGGDAGRFGFAIMGCTLPEHFYVGRAKRPTVRLR